MVIGDFKALPNNGKASEFRAVRKATPVSSESIKSRTRDIISSYRTVLDDVSI